MKKTKATFHIQRQGKAVFNTMKEANDFKRKLKSACKQTPTPKSRKKVVMVQKVLVVYLITRFS